MKIFSLFSATIIIKSWVIFHFSIKSSLILPFWHFCLKLVLTPCFTQLYKSQLFANWEWIFFDATIIHWKHLTFAFAIWNQWSVSIKLDVKVIHYYKCCAILVILRVILHGIDKRDYTFFIVLISSVSTRKIIRRVKNHIWKISLWIYPWKVIMLTVKQIMEKLYEYKVVIELYFIDFQHMCKLRCYKWQINIATLITTVTIKIKKGDTEKFKSSRGVRQGGTLSTLFNLS